MDVVLLGGLWLPHQEWDEVVATLAELGHRGVPVLLPGQGDGNRTARLEDQVAAVLLAIDESEGKPLVVGHSASSALAWIAADARSQQVAGVVLVGGFPTPDGATYADFFPVVDGVMPFPGWEPFEGPDSADLDQATRDRLTAEMIPVPERQPRGRTARGREAVRRPGDAHLSRVLARSGAGVDRLRRGARTASCEAAGSRRHRLGPLADGHPAGAVGGPPSGRPYALISPRGVAPDRADGDVRGCCG